MEICPASLDCSQLVTTESGRSLGDGGLPWEVTLALGFPIIQTDLPCLHHGLHHFLALPSFFLPPS